MNRRAFLRSAGALSALLALGGLAPAQDPAPAARPNFIFFITDDISPDDLGCYGHGVVRTPNLDRMAREGLVFDNAYLTASSCSPSRCSIITGRYPHNTGAPELHTTLPLDQVTFPGLLRAAGYHTVLSGKNHMGDVKRAFEVIARGGGPGGEGDWVDLLRDRPRDKPFFMWFASNDAHRQWQYNDEAPRYDPDDVEPPPFLYDGPDTRKDLADYYHEVSRTDFHAGKLREELERQGIADNTWFVYCSDNGRPFPRCKTRVLDSGIKTPLIVWAPGRVKPARTESLVSSVDFAATFLDLAGVDKSPTVQGVSIAPILRDPAATIRDYVFAEHNWHVFQAHERMVRQGDWVYIRNAWPERLNMCVESGPQYPAGEELWNAEAEGKLAPRQRDVFLRPRHAEELFNVADDPNQFNNLAGDPKYAGRLAALRMVLDRWIDETGDSVQDNPTGDRQDVRGTELPGFKRGEFPGADRGAASVTRPGPVRAIGG